MSEEVELCPECGSPMRFNLMERRTWNNPEYGEWVCPKCEPELYNRLAKEEE